MAPKKEVISLEKYWNLMKDYDEMRIKVEQINALACALGSMVTYASDSKWEIIADMIKELSTF